MFFTFMFYVFFKFFTFMFYVFFKFFLFFRFFLFFVSFMFMFLVFFVLFMFFVLFWLFAFFTCFIFMFSMPCSWPRTPEGWQKVVLGTACTTQTVVNPYMLLGTNVTMIICLIYKPLFH